MATISQDTCKLQKVKSNIQWLKPGFDPTCCDRRLLISDNRYLIILDRVVIDIYFAPFQGVKFLKAKERLYIEAQSLLTFKTHSMRRANDHLCSFMTRILFYAVAG